MQSWAFSDPSLNERATSEGVADISTITKTLGFLWDCSTDTLQLPLFFLCSTTAPKRDLLRGLSSIFDPLGFITPLSIPVRILMQEIWKEQLEWDDPLPAPFSDR